MQGIEFERVLLSSIIFEPSIFGVVIKEGLNYTDFSIDFHQKVFKAIEELNIDSYIEEGLIATKLGNSFDERLMLAILTANPVHNIIPYVKNIISKASLSKLRTDAVALVAMIDEGASYSEAISYSQKYNNIETRGTSLKIHKLSEIHGCDAEFIGKSFLPFPKATVSMVAAAGGVGKTFLLIQAAMRIIDEDNLKIFMWLTEDKIEISKKRAEVIANDVMNSNLNKYDDMFYMAGSDSETTHFLESTKEGIRVSSEFYRFQKMVEDFDVIIIDPLIAVFGGDENSNPHAKQFISLFTTWAANTGKTIIFIHHATKGTSTQRGASAFADAVRLIYQIEKIHKKDSEDSSINQLDNGMRNIIVAKDNYGSTKYLGSTEVKKRIFPAEKRIPIVNARILQR